MREILFRGKRENGKWVEGCLIHVPEYRYTCILQDESNVHSMDYPYLDYDLGTIDGYATPVIPETIGQFTGLTDKNGKKIFEGDIVRHYNNSLEEYDVGVIYWDFDFVGWRRTSTGGFHKIPNNTYQLSTSCDYEIIGNIHDNPELLKEMG